MNSPAVAPPVVLKLPLAPNLEMSPNAEDRFSASILLIAASSVIGSKALPVNTSPIWPLDTSRSLPDSAPSSSSPSL